MRSVHPIHGSAGVVPLAKFHLHDLESVRLVLRGSSCVDWVRLNFESDDDISAFIRVNGLEPDAPTDRDRLRGVMVRAIGYLEEHLRYRVPEVLREVADVRKLFHYASQTRGRRVYRFYACMLLKVMHIIHHVDAYELLSRLPLSDAEIGVLLQGKIEHVVRGLLERRFPIVEFSGNRKRAYSVYSKLLAKKSTQAAQILDKLRFRFIVERLEDIPPLVLALSRELLPFSYVIPAQTHNSLVDLHRILIRSGNVIAYRAKSGEHQVNELPVADLVAEQRNEFSGPDYRVLNFVADVPLRVDGLVPERPELFRRLGRVVFGAVEFQLVDRITAQKNEAGANRHLLYKQRQRQTVKQRLEAGRRNGRETEIAEGES